MNIQLYLNLNIDIRLGVFLSFKQKPMKSKLSCQFKTARLMEMKRNFIEF